MKRKIKKSIQRFLRGDLKKKALLITGARQIGKTYIVRECLREEFSSVIEINFVENEEARKIFSDFKDSKDILLRLSAIADKPLIKDETVVFLDEVQECKEMVTAVKFLVEEGSFRYVLSGSLLGVELKDIRSVPVGYMQIMEMYPMDFEEFCMANQVGAQIMEMLKECYQNVKPVDALIHDKMMELFRLYLIVGGMPEVVQRYIDTNNLQQVIELQKQIIAQYKKDIAKYDPGNKLYLEDIFNLIPSELNNKNKRFIMKSLNENFKFSRYEHSFIWLKDAGVALPVYCASEPAVPLLLSKSTNLFKLFLSDVGLLAAMYADGFQMKILMNELNMNYDAIYENVVAQELKCHGFDLFYYNNNRLGELDFLIEYQGKVLPIEIKSGKAYERHAALNNCMTNPRYGIEKSYVFCNANIKEKGNIRYYPIYMISFVQKEELGEMIYKPDFSILM
ncbi:MAG: ATP-binding protein [Lachnospiraceae bacterium]|nr:ATP-binding protein [Lachnospiraceae bacterium]